MTAQERVACVLRGDLPDRVPVVLQGMRPHGAFERHATAGRVLDRTPVWPDDPGHDPSVERLMQMVHGRAEMHLTWGPPPNFCWTALDAVPHETQVLPAPVEGYTIHRTVCHTPAGDLVHEEFVSPIGLPPYTRRHFIHDEDDLRRFLSIPYVRVPVDRRDYERYCEATTDDCITIIMPGYAPAATLYSLVEPETFLIWTRERRAALLDIVALLAERRLQLVRDLLAADIGPLYQTLGHEEFIPPLLGPQDLEDFVMRFDRPLADLLHARGAWLYCHCHGRVGAFLEAFAAAGLDCLQPLEPPPMGDTDLADAKRRIGGQVTLWGNIETHDLMTRSPEEIRAMVAQTVLTGKPGGRFCLTTSAEVLMGPRLDPRTLENLRVFIDTGLEYGRY